jgi:predicted esterase
VQGRAGDRRALVYLPGRCGDNLAVRFFPRAVRERGTFIGMRGDLRCDAPGRFKWSVDPDAIDRRIAKALAAVGATRDAPFEEIVLMGYSEGATRVEFLARRFPSRYPRVLLAGAPRAPKSPIRDVRTAIVAGALDRRAYLEEATADLAKRGADIAIFVLPGAHHGEYGDEAERVMSEALGWLVR